MEVGNIMANQIKLIPEMLAIRAMVQAQAVPHLVQFPANVPGKAQECGPNTCDPALHMKHALKLQTIGLNPS